MDTIAALATARGIAALAVVRVSGPRAVAVVDACLPHIPLGEMATHTVQMAYFRHPLDGRRIDQVVVTLFRAPLSSTGEDVVEITCHGGEVAWQLVLQALYAAGARPAEPGEFTQRAFLNGKLDLAQAEAVAELIHADSERAHFTSLAHLRGRYSELLEALREELLEVASFVELELDFSDEDVAFADRPRIAGLLHRARNLVSDLLGSYHFGALVRDGVKVVLAGRPNAGKSTLLNRLVGYDRAIVSPTAGTTRDEIEAEATLDGLRFRFTDTAGLRLTPDAIEAEGVRRARARMQEADLVLYLYDATCGMDEEEVRDVKSLRDARPSLPIVLLANKADLCTDEPGAPLPGFPFLALSAHTAKPNQLAFEALLALLIEQTAGELRNADAAYVVTNQRHRHHLRDALEALDRADLAFQSGGTGEVLALDLRVALHALGSITGAITNEDILSQIFSRFCIGK